jgi:hypothetical protein
LQATHPSRGANATCPWFETRAPHHEVAIKIENAEPCLQIPCISPVLKGDLPDKPVPIPVFFALNDL